VVAGQNIGRIITGILEKQVDNLVDKVDYPIIKSRHDVLMPPPYKKVTSLSFGRRVDHDQ
jgi:hypothetical protein